MLGTVESKFIDPRDATNRDKPYAQLPASIHHSAQHPKQNLGGPPCRENRPEGRGSVSWLLLVNDAAADANLVAHHHAHVGNGHWSHVAALNWCNLVWPEMGVAVLLKRDVKQTLTTGYT